MLKIIILSILLMGEALILFVQDYQKKKISLILYLLFLLTFIINQFLYIRFFQNSYYILNFILSLFFLIILVYYNKNKKIAFADITLIIFTVLLFSIKIALLILLIASLLGILIGIFLKKNKIGFVGILALIISISAIIINFLLIH